MTKAVHPADVEAGTAHHLADISIEWPNTITSCQFYVTLSMAGAKATLATDNSI
jgi:hypothetical protein